VLLFVFLTVLFWNTNRLAQAQYENAIKAIEYINSTRPSLATVQAGVIIQDQKGVWIRMPNNTSINSHYMLLTADNEAMSCRPAVYNCVYQSYTFFKDLMKQMGYRMVYSETLTVLFFAKNGTLHSYNGRADFLR
jgi:type IV secretory pathway VirB9-like protein